MTDLIEGRSAVRDAVRRAEEAAGVFRDDQGNEVYADPTTPEVPELEGAVPVAASEQPLPAEPAPPEAPAEADTPVQQEAPPSQTPEELQAEIARLQEQLVTKDSFIGRQSTDVGELRAEVDALRAQVTAPVTPQPQVQPMAITQDMLDNDPGQATQLAFQQAKRAAEANGGVPDPALEHVLHVSFEAWKEENEFTAGQWLTDRRIEKERADSDAKIEALRADIAEVRAPQVARDEVDAKHAAWSDAFLQMQKSYPDFLEVDASTGKTNAQRLLEEVAPQFPAIGQLIADGDAAAKVQGLTLLYDKGRLGSPERMKQELQSAAEEAAASTAAARAAAATVNGQSTAGQGSTVEMTEEEAEAQKYVTRMKGRASLASGWTGRGNA